MKGVKGGKEVAEKLGVDVSAKPADIPDGDRFDIPNLAERLVAAGEPNIFEGTTVRPNMVKRAEQDYAEAGGWDFQGDGGSRARTEQIDAEAQANVGKTEAEVDREKLGVDEGDVITGDFGSMFDQFRSMPGKDNQGPEEFKQWLIDNQIPFDPIDFEAWTLKYSHKQYGGKDPVANYARGGLIDRPMKRKTGLLY